MAWKSVSTAFEGKISWWWGTILLIHWSLLFASDEGTSADANPWVKYCCYGSPEGLTPVLTCSPSVVPTVRWEWGRQHGREQLLGSASSISTSTPIHFMPKEVHGEGLGRSSWLCYQWNKASKQNLALSEVKKVANNKTRCLVIVRN